MAPDGGPSRPGAAGAAPDRRRRRVAAAAARRGNPRPRTVAAGYPRGGRSRRLYSSSSSWILKAWAALTTSSAILPVIGA